ncbi:YraN family protein [uncultured Serinicoccus sp.]|uniref:YraN family protein n=1 Tax=uncultured Serinicoccus sp. TaxID=735514 RepID=UPI002610E5BF|nr:YraN family protein [uncultured Serinicoccus sp.]
MVQEEGEMDDGGMPWARAREIGDRGEELVCAHVRALGWMVLERNWRCPEGELDVVAHDGRQLVFCEVKTRRSARFGEPVEAVGREKAHRLRRLAWAWLDAHGRRGADFRIDVFGLLSPPDAPTRLTHLRGVA